LHNNAKYFLLVDPRPNIQGVVQAAISSVR
jgi:hypothetical protein